MKRTLSVTLVVGGLIFAVVTLFLSRQRQLLIAEEAQAAEDRVRALAETPPRVSLPGEQGGAGAVSPAIDESVPNAQPILPQVKPEGGQINPVAPSGGEKAVELKLFRLKNADASEASRTIQPLLPREAKVSVDQRTNTLILSANAESLLVIQALLIALDDEPTARSLPNPAANAFPPLQRLPITSPPPGMKDNEDTAMDREAKQLAARVRAAKEPEKSKLRADLEKLTEKHFEHRQQRRNAEIADMADRVDKLRVAHHRRQESKPDILKRRIADLLDENNELKWDDTSTKPSSNIPVATPMPAPQPQLPKLDGEWLVTLPAGFEFVGKIEKQPEGCWSFQEMRNMSGYYQLDGNTLKRVATDPKENREYEWLILNDNVMVLTKGPMNVGSDYRGATLRRGAKPKPQAERSQLVPGENDPLAVSERADPRKSAIQAARRKAAEARLHLAKFELDVALQAARKVPGTISSTELEKLKTNVAILEAELELVIAGGDPRESKANATSQSEPVAAAKLQKAEVLLNSAKVEFDRLKKLDDSKAVSREEVERAATAVEEAKANVDVAKAELEIARTAGSSPEQ